MNKNISISDEVYRGLKREKGDRSFSGVIKDRLETGGRLAKVSGQGIFGAGTYEAVKEKVSGLSEDTVKRFEIEARHLVFNEPFIEERIKTLLIFAQ